jgi:PilZ domain
METAMSRQHSERRGARRRGTGEHGIVNARIRPGHQVTLIDLSPGGALVEADRRLLPGSPVELHIQSADRHASVRGYVLRCSVVRVQPASICYRGAIAFDRHLPWFAEAAGYELPLRGDATPQVL